jgi:hypothetical protein
MMLNLLKEQQEEGLKLSYGVMMMIKHDFIFIIFILISFFKQLKHICLKMNEFY